MAAQIAIRLDILELFRIRRFIAAIDAFFFGISSYQRSRREFLDAAASP